MERELERVCSKYDNGKGIGKRVSLCFLLFVKIEGNAWGNAPKTRYVYTTDVKPAEVEGVAAGVTVRGWVAGRAILPAMIVADSETSWIGEEPPASRRRPCRRPCQQSHHLRPTGSRPFVGRLCHRPCRHLCRRLCCRPYRCYCRRPCHRPCRRPCRRLCLCWAAAAAAAVRTRVVEEVVPCEAPCEEAATVAAPAALMAAAGASMAVAEGLDGGAWTAAEEGAQIPVEAAVRPAS